MRGIKTFPKKNKKRHYGRKKYNKLPKKAKEKIQKKLLQKVTVQEKLL